MVRLLGVAVFLAVVADSGGVGVSASGPISRLPIIWETTYTGTYSFSDYNRSYGRAAGTALITSEDFTWSRVVSEWLYPQKNGSVTIHWDTELSASGDYHSYATGVTSSNVNCTLSTTKPVVEKRVILNGAYNTAILARSNPPVSFGWALPLGGASIGLAPTAEDEIRVTGGSDCPRPDDFLRFTPGRIDSEWQDLPSTQELLDAFSGTRTVRFNALPYDRSFNYSMKRSGSAPAILTTSITEAEIHSHVTFGRFPATLQPEKNKVGQLLLDDALTAIAGSGSSASGDVPAATPDPETIVLPSAPGVGSVTLDVTGVITGQVHGPRLSAGSSSTAPQTVLETGSTHGGSDATMLMPVTPTSAGHALFSGSHGKVPLTVKMSLAYGGETFSGSRSIVIPEVRPTASIASVTVAGTPHDPVFQIHGAGLGTLPARNPSTTPSNQKLCPVNITGTPGYDYGTSLYIEGVTKQFAAGRYIPQNNELDCLGLIVTKYTPSEVDLAIGGFYQQFYPKYEIAPGDQIRVVIGTTTITIHADYGKTVSSSSRP